VPNWSVDSLENNYNCCHQISYFKATSHQILFRLLRPSSWILKVLLLREGWKGKREKTRGGVRRGEKGGKRRGVTSGRKEGCQPPSLP